MEHNISFIAEPYLLYEQPINYGWITNDPLYDIKLIICPFQAWLQPAELFQLIQSKLFLNLSPDTLILSLLPGKKYLIWQFCNIFLTLMEQCFHLMCIVLLQK